MSFQGAGGTAGGTGRFFLGFVMLVAGGYMFFDAVQVHHGFGMGSRIGGFGGFGLTTGMVLVPFIFGIGMVFYNSENPIGWILAGASLAMLLFGVISSIDFHLRRMSAFELITILTLFIGGLGIMVSGLRETS
ncbi:MAG: hypothetical protein ACRBF0_20400 [Calditrichia bacterium]